MPAEEAHVSRPASGRRFDSNSLKQGSERLSTKAANVSDAKWGTGAGLTLPSWQPLFLGVVWLQESTRLLVLETS